MSGRCVTPQVPEEVPRELIIIPVHRESTRPASLHETEPGTTGGVPTPVLPPPDEPRLPRQAHLRGASESNDKVHGVDDPDAVQLRVEPTRGVPVAATLRDRAQGRDQVGQGHGQGHVKTGMRIASVRFYLLRLSCLHSTH